MKPVLDNKTHKGDIVTDEQAATMAATHRIIDVKEAGENSAGKHYVDVWGGPWFVPHGGEARSTSGIMDKWS
jgi:hypothetical protein